MAEFGHTLMQFVPLAIISVLATWVVYSMWRRGVLGWLDWLLFCVGRLGVWAIFTAAYGAFVAWYMVLPFLDDSQNLPIIMQVWAVLTFGGSAWITFVVLFLRWIYSGLPAPMSPNKIKR